jgi:hypothetical protein
MDLKGSSPAPRSTAGLGTGALFWRRRPRRPGDGEVCVTALETALSGTFGPAQGSRSPARAGPRRTIRWLQRGSDDAAKTALREISPDRRAPRSLTRGRPHVQQPAVDMRVTQLVDGNIHAMRPEATRARVIAELGIHKIDLLSQYKADRGGRQREGGDMVDGGSEIARAAARAAAAKGQSGRNRAYNLKRKSRADPLQYSRLSWHWTTKVAGSSTSPHETHDSAGTRHTEKER